MNETVLTRSAIFYIDGSVRPHNPGYIGYGFHGYFYEPSETPVFAGPIWTHTTKGYLRQGESQVGVQWVKPLSYVDAFGSDAEILTNNVAEIKGLLNLMLHLDKSVNDKTLKRVDVYTDSEYLRKSMTEWIVSWERKGWVRQDGQPVSNKEILLKTYNLYKSFKERSVDLNIHWIRSHEGHLGNERADLLAGIGMGHSRARKILRSLVEEPAKGYWKEDIEKHPFLAFRRLYFNSVKEHNVPGRYYMAESSDGEFVLGKPSATAGYSVVFIKKPNYVIELIREQQFKNSLGVNAIMELKMDSVFSSSVYPWISLYGEHCITGTKNSHSMVLVNKAPVTVEKNPTGLSMQALDHIALLEELLNNSLVQTENKILQVGASVVQRFDITNLFFKKVEDKKGVIKFELLPEFVVGYKNMVIDVDLKTDDGTRLVKVPYALGYDCLPRNHLKHLEKEEPYIELLVWTEGSIMRYVTTINCLSGVGIWSHHFANQIVLPSK